MNRCHCGEPSCRRCGTPADGTYPPAADCLHPEPAIQTSEWDLWLDTHPWSTTPGVGRVCLATPTDKAA